MMIFNIFYIDKKNFIILILKSIDRYYTLVPDLTKYLNISYRIIKISFSLVCENQLFIILTVNYIFQLLL